MSSMFRLNSTVLQCFICLLLLWLAIIDSFPSLNMASSSRHERDTSETVFTTGELDLVIEAGNDSLHFLICCPAGGCNQGSFLFCFSTTKQQQGPEIIYGCGARTCAYKVAYNGSEVYSLSAGLFSSTDKCFNGKVTTNDIQLSYTDKADQEYKTKTSPGCPLNIFQPGNRLLLDVREIPAGVTVTATNAHKYVEPTTLSPSTAPPTAETTNATKETSSPAPATKEETGMSDALKFSLIGVGLFVLILIVGGIGFAIYWFCFKKKKSLKPLPPVTVAQNDTAATKQVSTAASIAKEKQPEVKSKQPAKAQKETKEVENSKLAPSTVVPSSAAPELPPPPTASKEPSVIPSKLQKSSLPGPSLEPSSVFNPPVKVRQSQPPELPPATPTVADLIGRVGRRYRIAGRKYFDTFDRVQTPHYEGIMDSMIRNKWITEDQALKVKREKFIRPPSEEELKLFAAPISVMYQQLEEMINDAAYYHKPHDDNPQCILIENEYHTYFVSLNAVVAHYAKYFKIGKEVPLEKCSVPLLLGIAMDRTQSEPLRRRALVIMTIKAVDLTKIFSEAQCIKLPYPMCVICLSYQLDRYLVDNVDRLHTFSSPNNSECTKSDGGQKTGGPKSVAGGRDGGKENSSSSKGGTKTSVSKEVAVAAAEKKKKMKKKGKKH